MEDLIRIFCVFSIISVALAASNHVPAVLWTNDNGLSFPSSLAGHTVDADAFHEQYLEKQLIKSKHNLVVFLQDKLSMEDITQHADVYNQHSDGAAFHNLKQIMESQPSTHIPSLQSVDDVLSKVKTIFEGRVHQVDKPYSVKNLPLGEQTSVIIVNLPATNGANVKQALADIDRIIGSVNDQLNEMGRPFTALYTAKKPSFHLDARSSMHQGRHLLETKSAEVNGSFWNVSGCLFVYIENITLLATKGPEKTKTLGSYTLPGSIEFEESSSTCKEATAELTVSYTDPKGTDNTGNMKLNSFKFTMKFMNDNNKTGYWNMTEFSIDYDGEFATEAIKADNEQMNRRSLRNIMAPYKYSYHCTYQPDLKPANTTSRADAQAGGIQTSLRLHQMQIQMFGTRNMAKKFGQVNDCQGFFDLATWSALISLFVLILILFFGLWMVTSIQTQDRFDDPKGKTIQVNVSE